MKEPKLTHTQRRNGVYYFRRKIPLDLVSHYRKSEITFSLETKERKEAEPLVRKWGVFYDEEFAQARLSPQNEISSPLPTAEAIKPINVPLVPIDINHSILKRVATMRAARARAQKEGASKLELWTLTIRNQFEMNSEYLKTGEHPLFENPDITEAEVFNIAVSHILEGTPLPFVPMLMPIAIAPMPQAASKDKLIYLNDIVRIWESEQKPLPRTVVQYETRLRNFETLIGKLAVTQISRKDVIAFKNALLEGGASPDKINNTIGTLQQMLTVALNQDIITSNPAVGIRVPNKKLAKASRLPFDEISLNKIFNSEIYTSKVRPTSGGGEAAYWLPLLALYTGARLEELSQLKTVDIRLEKYDTENGGKAEAWIIDITNEGDGQKLKNDGSRRKVPIHKTLINLGFIKYVESQQTEFIFPKLLVTPKFNERSANWSKWFGRYLREKIEVTDRRMVFHSFRHTFKDLMRHAGVDGAIHDALTGHAANNVGGNYGGIYFPIRPLVNAMEKYSVPNLIVGGISI